MKHLFLLLSAFIPLFSFSQESKRILQNYISTHLSELNLTQLVDFEISSEVPSKAIGVTHVYVRQIHNELPIVNANGQFSLKDGIVLYPRLDFHSFQNETYTPSSNVKQIIENFILEIDTDRDLVLSDWKLKKEKATFSTQHQTVELQKCFFLAAEKLVSAWQFSIRLPEVNKWYSVVLNAETGETIQLNNWVNSCSFDHASSEVCRHENLSAFCPPPPPGADQYLVYALPLVNPDEGAQSVLTNPSDATFSPFGWHDTDFISGDEFTITNGNNVHAYEDADNDDLPGFSPDGGSSLNFNFPVDTNTPPTNYINGAITNLFYMNNMMHDVWAYYGFDEASGNFQFMNQNNGLGNDHVLAEAQDGSGTNNANFGTPPEGENPRMQMYIWTGANVPNLVTVNAPAALSGAYAASTAGFGPQVPAIPINSDIVFVIDDGTETNDGCDVIQNSAEINGKIAVVRRGNCQFNLKVENAQNAGAIAVIIYNNQGGTTTTSMSGTNANVLIPSVMISQNDGDDWQNAVNLGDTINVTLVNNGNPDDTDSDLDNGIIAHEYGHGISNRLVGGPENVDCLYNDEQMGEGWSDFFGIVMTIKPGDVGAQPTGVGTYVTNQPIDGTGIRPAPYSTSFAINNYTYAETNNSGVSMPHGIGFVWCSMLWDLTWALIDSTSFDPNLKTGTGGNNVAMALVTEGLKLTACNPGFVDARNGILQADELLYGGAHTCTIWKVFARRGLGYSADQGDPMSRSDQTEAFDLPPSCLPGASINELENAFEVYPNPTSGKIEIKGNIATINSVELFSLNGSKLQAFDPNQISLEGYSTGFYLLKIGSESGSTTVRIVKN